MEPDDQSLIRRIRDRDERAFEQVFRQHYQNLHVYAITLLKDEAVAEEVVQTIFYRIWERAGKLEIAGPIAAYLYRAVHNEALNHFKHLKVRAEHQLYVSHRNHSIETPAAALSHKETEGRVREALASLPEQCRTVFQLSRFESLRYADIALRLGISVKTVENHMGKALRILRERLADLVVLLYLYLHTKL